MLSSSPAAGASSSGCSLGAATFFIGDLLIDRKGGSGRKSIEGQDSSSSAMAIVLGTILDGIPESVVLGLTLLDGEGVSIAVLVAVFLSNLPEAMASTSGFVKAGRPVSRIMLIWLVVVVVSGLSSMLGFAVLGDAPSATIAIVQGFAAGAILTMLADTMMPEAFKHGGARRRPRDDGGVRARLPDRNRRARWSVTGRSGRNAAIRSVEDRLAAFRLRVLRSARSGPGLEP